MEKKGSSSQEEANHSHPKLESKLITFIANPLKALEMSNREEC